MTSFLPSRTTPGRQGAGRCASDSPRPPLRSGEASRRMDTARAGSGSPSPALPPAAVWSVYTVGVHDEVT